jgi:hypothetical protein
MIQHAKIAIIALALLAPGLAVGGENLVSKDSQARYLQTAKEYRMRADDLSGRKRELEAPQQAIVNDLIQVYGELAETKVALAEAVGSQDWGREEELERKYYRLKDEEQRLWDDLERSK